MKINKPLISKIWNHIIYWGIGIPAVLFLGFMIFIITMMLVMAFIENLATITLIAGMIAAFILLGFLWYWWEKAAEKLGYKKSYE